MNAPQGLLEAPRGLGVAAQAPPQHPLRLLQVPLGLQVLGPRHVDGGVALAHLLRLHVAEHVLRCRVVLGLGTQIQDPRGGPEASLATTTTKKVIKRHLARIQSGQRRIRPILCVTLFQLSKNLSLVAATVFLW